MTLPALRRGVAISAAVGVVALAGLGGVSCARRPAAEAWQACTIPTDADFRGLWFIDSLNGWMTGGGYAIDGGIVGRTRDGGRTWSFRSGILPGSERFSLGEVQFRDSLHGCAVGSSGIVVLTDDGGETWRPVHYGRGSGDGLSDLQFLDERTGFAAGSASIVRTDDGGQTWAPVLYNRAENGYITPFGIHFLDSRRGWLTSHGGLLMRTEDGGASWNAVPLPLRAGERPTLWDVTFCDEQHGWVVGDFGSVFRTTDGGATWTLETRGVPDVRVIPPGEPPRPHEVVPELETPPDRLSLCSVRFLDPNHGCAVGYYNDVGESVVLRTSDGGSSWRVERVQPGEYLRSLFLFDASHAWTAGDRSRTAPQVVLRYAGTGS